MKFMLTFTLKPETRDTAIGRFLKTGGQPPKGATLRGRWTRADLGGGYVLLESDDPSAVTAFALAWSDLVDLAAVPVVEDAELTQVFTRAGMKSA